MHLPITLNGVVLSIGNPITTPCIRHASDAFGMTCSTVLSIVTMQELAYSTSIDTNDQPSSLDL